MKIELAAQQTKDIQKKIKNNNQKQPVSKTLSVYQTLPLSWTAQVPLALLAREPKLQYNFHESKLQYHSYRKKTETGRLDRKKEKNILQFVW